MTNKTAVRRHREPDGVESRGSLSVRSRIVVSILAVTALGLAGSGIASYLVQRERALATVDEQLMQTVSAVKSVARSVETSGKTNSVEAVLRASMQQLIPSDNESVLGFIDGKPALVPASRLPFRLDKDPALVKRLANEAEPANVMRGTAVSTEGTLRYLIIPVSVTGDPQTGMYVAAFNLDTVLGAVAQSFAGYIVVALIALALVGLVAWFVAGRLLRPIRLLSRAATANTAADLSERIPVTGRDDVSELTRSINGMFDRLEDAFASQRRLIDDVGHELRTPITIIRGHLELLDTHNADELEATRGLAIDELDRMNDLVGEISLLAESRAPQFIECAEVDVETLLNSVAAKARALDQHRDWTVAVRHGSIASIANIDERRITQALLQLADNAVKYSTPGTPIALTSDTSGLRTDVWLELSVGDQGPGIPEDAQELIFERFGRLESTRNQDGSGLGLAIVAAIAEAHGGRAFVTSAPGDGSRFSISVPLGIGYERSATSQEEQDES